MVDIFLPRGLVDQFHSDALDHQSQLIQEDIAAHPIPVAAPIIPPPPSIVSPGVTAATGMPAAPTIPSTTPSTSSPPIDSGSPPSLESILSSAGLAPPKPAASVAPAPDSATSGADSPPSLQSILQQAGLGASDAVKGAGDALGGAANAVTSTVGAALGGGTSASPTASSASSTPAADSSTSNAPPSLDELLTRSGLSPAQMDPSTAAPAGNYDPSAIGPRTTPGDTTTPAPAAPRQDTHQSQFAMGLSDADAYAACGPAAAIGFARQFGRNPTSQEAMDLARTVGWTPGQGMAGVASEQALLQKMGIATKLESTDNAQVRSGQATPLDWSHVTRDAMNGNPVVLDTPGHYMLVDDARPGPDGVMQYHIGTSGTDLRGGQAWETRAQLEGHAVTGAVRSALYADNPNSPHPSVANGPSSATQTTAGLSGGGDLSGQVGAAGQQILTGAAQAASWLGDQGQKALQAVLVTEGGLNKARGDNGKSAGPLQFYEEGQLANLARQLGQTLEQAKTWVEENPVKAVQWAIGTPDAPGYLGRAIQDGIQKGLSGADLATYAQQHGQVSVSPERAGQNFNALFGGGQPVVSSGQPGDIATSSSNLPDYRGMADRNTQMADQASAMTDALNRSTAQMQTDTDTRNAAINKEADDRLAALRKSIGDTVAQGQSAPQTAAQVGESQPIGAGAPPPTPPGGPPDGGDQNPLQKWGQQLTQSIVGLIQHISGQPSTGDASTPPVSPVPAPGGGYDPSSMHGPTPPADNDIPARPVGADLPSAPSDVQSPNTGIGAVDVAGRLASAAGTAAQGAATSGVADVLGVSPAAARQRWSDDERAQRLQIQIDDASRGKAGPLSPEDARWLDDYTANQALMVGQVSMGGGAAHGLTDAAGKAIAPLGEQAAGMAGRTLEGGAGLLGLGRDAALEQLSATLARYPEEVKTDLRTFIRQQTDAGATGKEINDALRGWVRDNPLPTTDVPEQVQALEQSASDLGAPTATQAPTIDLTDTLGGKSGPRYSAAARAAYAPTNPYLLPTEAPSAGATPMAMDDVVAHMQSLESQYAANDVRIEQIENQLDGIANSGNVVRPQWATGMSDDAIRAIAKYLDENPNTAGWGDKYGPGDIKDVISYYRSVGNKDFNGLTPTALRAERQTLQQQQQWLMDAADHITNTAGTPGIDFYAPTTHAAAEPLPFDQPIAASEPGAAASPADLAPNRVEPAADALPGPAASDTTPSGRIPQRAPRAGRPALDTAPVEPAQASGAPPEGPPPPPPPPPDGTAVQPGLPTLDGGAIHPRIKQLLGGQPEYARIAQDGLNELQASKADPATIARYFAGVERSSGLPSGIDANAWFRSLRNGAMAGGLQTFGHVMFNIPMQILWGLPRDALAAGVRGRPEQIPAGLIGTFKGFSAAAEAAIEQLRYGITSEDAAAGGRVGGTVAGETALPPSISLRTDNRALQIGANVLQGTVGTHGAAQTFIQKLGFYKRATEMAWTQAKSEGLSGSPFSARVSDIMAHLHDPQWAKIATEAQNFGDRMALRGEQGKVGTKLRGIAGAGIGGNLLIPFESIANKVLTGGVEATPGLGAAGLLTDLATARAGYGPYAKGATDVTRGAVTPIAERAANQILGTGIFALGLGWAGAGILSGSGPSSPQERANALDAGQQFDGIKLGNVFVPGHMLGRLWYPLAAAANVVEAQKYAKQGATPEQMIEDGIQRTAQFFSNETFLRQFGDLAAALKDTTGRQLENFVARQVETVIPQDAVMRDVGTIMDPTSRAPANTGNLPTDIASRVESQLPILRQSQPPRISASTGWDTPNRSGVLGSLAHSPAPDDPVAAEVLRLEMAGQHIAITPPKASYAGGTQSPDQLTTLERTMGHSVHSYALSTLLNPAYAGLSDTQKADALRKAMSQATHAGDISLGSQVARDPHHVATMQWEQTPHYIGVKGTPTEIATQNFQIAEAKSKLDQYKKVLGEAKGQMRLRQDDPAAFKLAQRERLDADKLTKAKKAIDAANGGALLRQADSAATGGVFAPDTASLEPPE